MTTAELNQKYFDSITNTYDSKPWFAKVNAQVTDILRSRLDWLGIPLANTGSNAATGDVKLLDYACGTGLMSRAYGPYVTVTRGIDVSSGMVSTFNTRMKEAGLSSERVHAVQGNLFDKANPAPAELSGAEWYNFDIATVGFGFHHFEDVAHAARQLKERLRPGGVMVLTDFLEGGDVKADEQGNPIEGSEGNHASAHKHSHDHSHGQHSSHGHDHGHGHHHHHGVKQHDFDDTDPEFKKKMSDSIVVPHFSIEGVKEIFEKAGYVDADVITLDEKSFMQFGGQKMWRTILIAKGRKPEEKEKSEL